MSKHVSTSIALLVMTLLAAWPAAAHQASDAYLQIRTLPAGLSVRLDLALRDIDLALDVDTDADARLTWGEIQAAWPRIEAYALQGLQVDGCPLHAVGRGLEQRSDGAYAVLHLASACLVTAEPAIRYTLLQEVDVTHRGLAKIELGGRPAVLRVLNPADAAHWPAGPAGAETAAANSSSASASEPQRAAAFDLQFVREGVHHIWTGYDHVLFLLCLLLPAVMRRTSRGWQPVERLAQAVWPVVGIVTAFTLAHSITLALAALRLVVIPAAVIEPLIALTIVVAALDNIWPLWRLPRSAVTFVFGLVHGFGFASVLAELDLPAARFAWALLQFNLGLELGQLAIVLVLSGLLYALRQQRGYARWVIQRGSWGAAAVGSWWLVQRVGLG